MLSWNLQPGVARIDYHEASNEAVRIETLLPRLSKQLNLTLRDRAQLGEAAWKDNVPAVAFKAGKGDEGWSTMFSDKDLAWLKRELSQPLDSAALHSFLVPRDYWNQAFDNSTTNFQQAQKSNDIDLPLPPYNSSLACAEPALPASDPSWGLYASGMRFPPACGAMLGRSYSVASAIRLN